MTVVPVFFDSCACKTYSKINNAGTFTTDNCNVNNNSNKSSCSYYSCYSCYCEDDYYNNYHDQD